MARFDFDTFLIEWHWTAQGLRKPIACARTEFEGISDFELSLRALKSCKLYAAASLAGGKRQIASIKAALDAFFGLNHHGVGEPMGETLSFAGYSNPPQKAVQRKQKCLSKAFYGGVYESYSLPCGSDYHQTKHHLTNGLASIPL